MVTQTLGGTGDLVNSDTKLRTAGTHRSTLLLAVEWRWRRGKRESRLRSTTWKHVMFRVVTAQTAQFCRF